MSSSAEVPGFEIEDQLGPEVYVATQLALGRRVALKLYPGRSEVPGRWPEHPGVARLFAAGTYAAGAYTASQLAAGGSLAQRLAARDITRAHALRLCDEVETTLRECPHGALSPGNVLIDASGHALLCDFATEPDRMADERALAALRTACEQLPRTSRRTALAALRATREGLPRAQHRTLGAAGRLPSAAPSAARDERPRDPHRYGGAAHRPGLVAPRRATVRGAAGAAIALAAIAVALLATRGDGDAPPEPLPGVIVVGDASTGEPRTVGCDGAPPVADAFACTLVQTQRDGRPFALPADGIIRRWTVRGARGELALQLVRPVGGGRYVQVATSRSTLAGRRGDLVALTIAPGGAVGVIEGAGAATVRFIGRLGAAPPRRPQAGPPVELALRLELEPRPAPARPEPRTGPARAGTVLERATAGWDESQTYAVVETGEEIALDVFVDGRRTARITIAGADPEGRLVLLTTELAPSVRWRNPDGRELERLFTRSASPEQVY